MSCCPYNITYFTNVPNSSIAYSDSMKSAFGQKPRVEVYYYDPESADFYNLNGVPSTEVKMVGDNIEIDHGGLASGYIKIS